MQRIMSIITSALNPITWQQVEQIANMLKEATITVPTAKVQVYKKSVICITILVMIIFVYSIQWLIMIYNWMVLKKQ